MLQVPALNASAVKIKLRSLDMLAIDTSAVRAIAQAAISVELFTIPLYMCTMYSIQGTHQINSKGLSYYKGREWPGLSTRAEPGSANEHAFNIIFSVFIQEMLHLQMAANLATAIGATPSFTGAELQDPDHGWTCYGPDLTSIPHIVDLKDTSSYKDVRVNLEALNNNQCELLLAIEQPEHNAREQLRGADIPALKYFPTVPLAGWSVDKTSADLPLFGTIGYLYECYARYISIEYTDGQSLWDKVFDSESVQQDMFNVTSKSHPGVEYPHFDTRFNSADLEGGAISSFDKAIDMMAAITDQGEGNATGITRYRRGGGQLTAVQPDHTEDHAALVADYPSYSSSGCPDQSADAAARFNFAKQDHYERFGQVKGLLPQVQTWEQWHAQGNSWSAAMLTNGDYDPATAPQNIPKPAEVAEALNRLKQDDSTFKNLSQVAGGAIYGIVSVLDNYWQDATSEFPYPSMVGAGDRMAICWAVLGRAADLTMAISTPDKDRLYHACQAMSLDPAHPEAQCAAVEVYHSCKGSNSCHAQGGCGFVHSVTSGGSCSAATLRAGAESGCGGPVPFSAPSDNKCRSLGGCAVPISASQLYPTTGVMQLFDFVEPGHTATPLQGYMGFEMGDNVYAKAWQAYARVVQARGGDAGMAPAATALRLALPPST